MRVLALLCLVFSFAAPLWAQEDDKTYLENLLQDALSGDDHQVRVTGFRGALSSEATLDTLTIADKDGIWLTMRGATLIWSRSALLGGYLDVTELSAAAIEVTRLPESEARITTEDTQATRFALPDLPVAVDIKKIAVEKVTLAPDVMGEAATLALLGSMSLNEGDGRAALDIRRLDRDDQITLNAGFSNASRILSLDLGFEEAQGGLVSSLLRIPESPSLSLSVAGEAPISDYTARIALTSDGARRFGGTVEIAALSAEVDVGYGFGARLSGDVRPLFVRDLHPFFGETSALDLRGSLFSNGRLVLEQLDVSSGALNVTSELALGADNLPERFALYGEIASTAPVRLPLSGDPTEVTSAEFAATYDAATSETWTATAEVFGLKRPDISATSLRLNGEGTIESQPLRQVTADLRFAARGLAPADPKLARALGQEAQGRLTMNWQADTPLDITELLLRAGDTVLRAKGVVQGLEAGFQTDGEATLISEDLSRFAGFAERPLTGRAEAQVTGRFTPLSGAFDVQMQANTDEIAIADPRIDPLLQGAASIQVDAVRNTEGTRLRVLKLWSDAGTIVATGQLSPTTGQLTIEADLNEVSQIEPLLDGPARLRGGFTWADGEGVTITRLSAGLAGARVTATGSIDPQDEALPVEGSVTLDVDDLSQFGGLIGRRLGGVLNAELAGSGEANRGIWDVSGTVDGSGFRSGIPELDRLVAGAVSAAFSGRIGDTALELRYLKLTSPQLLVNAAGDGPGAPIAVSGRLSDLGLLAPGVSGPATARGTLTPRDKRGRELATSLDATGPGGTLAAVSGTIFDYGNRLALNLAGTAPLSLANSFISPRSVQGEAQFDLSLDGPPRLSSLSGNIAFTGARAALPTLNMALNNLTGGAELRQGRAEVALTGDAGTGGQFQVTGPIQLVPGFPGTLAISLNALGLFDPTLYQTTVSGTLNAAGELTGGARVEGTVALGPTELRVPSGSGTIVGTLPDINHINEPARVRETRSRAGLIKAMKASAAVYPIDITITAPSRIFVRGRGLDAELGGSVRITGTTADMQPSGVFELIRGRLDILGKRLVLTEGLIDLRGALDPYLRFVAEARSDDAMLLVILEGLASAPNVIFTSSPELPQEEVVARLLFGRDLASMSAFQAAQLVSAVATLSGRYQGGITGRLRDSLGLSDLDITTTDDGATQFTAGAYISDNVYSEITADSEGNQEINLNLDISDSVTLKGSVNNESNTGIGVFFEKDY
ncbi:DUF490 domain-containing protein [Roseovarius faecimaris]|uniref:DUF490 domain-containing protein n=1 Tax=Roseovarius faecimaris TaxID=2494550 RepID=A0A6I6IQJ6_9RHOB|nr:translocation/assembly module TamB domain-containing protein [Roseovarius faecimaris]QGX99359.1 DUF490 domain-containing protein [Roseovarius faecimaris]